MKRRVLIVTDEMEVGGSQRQIFYILTNLDTERFEPTLLYFREESWLLDELKKRGVRCVKISKKGAIDPLFLSRFIGFLRKEKFDVVHAFAFSAELWTVVALFLAQGRFISSIRGRYEWYSKRHWQLKGWISRRSVKIVSNSEAGLNYAEEQCGLDTGKAVIVHNGITDAPLLASDDVLADYRKNHQVLIGFVGRLVDHKNLECLLRALGRLRNKGIDAGVIMVGDGPLRQSLEAFVKSRDLQGVYFLGERDDVHAIFSACDIAVLPSFREGFSNTILEAMQVGTPMVASRVGGTPEIIKDEVNGMLFESDNDKELSEKLTRLIKDPGLAKALGEAGQAAVSENFSVPHMINKIQAIYEAV